MLRITGVTAAVRRTHPSSCDGYTEFWPLASIGCPQALTDQAADSHRFGPYFFLILDP